jgi:hemoglobin-like flavoprotein
MRRSPVPRPAAVRARSFDGIVKRPYGRSTAGDAAELAQLPVSAAEKGAANRGPDYRGAPAMTPKGIGLIRDSWAAVEPIADTAAGLFYGRLFELDPAIERLFRRTDMAGQRKVLMQTLTVVVKSLDKLDQIVPAVQALARRHAGYGVREAHYATVGEALLWTLEQGLGEAFTPEVRAAWTSAYGTVASVMIEAARAETATEIETAA